MKVSEEMEKKFLLVSWVSQNSSVYAFGAVFFSKVARSETEENIAGLLDHFETEQDSLSFLFLI